MAEKGRVFTGARARFLINGKKVGYATNISGTEEIEYQPVEVLDNIEVEEHVAVAYRVSFTASTIQIIGETLKSLGLFPKTGQSPEEHLTNIMIQGDLVLAIQDSKTKKTTRLIEQVKAASQNFNTAARGISGEDVSFVGIRMKDESEL